MNLKFTKMHGAGNDFVVIEKGDISDEALPQLATKLCDRHFGIGADGLLVISPSEVADIKMRIFNSDGTEAQMCGNGIRCIGKYLYDNHLLIKFNPKIETLLDIKELELHVNGENKVDSATVDMGKASLLSDKPETLTVASGDYNILPVTTGNPHCVVIVDDPTNFEVAGVGRQLENHPYWPEKTNVEFVAIESDHSIRQRTWERGVGETLACGTGACAAAFALTSAGHTNWPVNVNLPGGTLIIDNKDGHLMMTGPAATVFEAFTTVF